MALSPKLGIPERFRDRSPRPPGEGQAAGRPPLPQPCDVLAAVGLLTVLPLCRPDRTSAAFGRATLFFPLVGLLMGALLVGLNAVLAGRVPSWLVAILLVAVWEAASGAALIRALSQGDAGALAVSGYVAVLLAKIGGVAFAAGARPAAVLFAPTLARWGMVVLAVGARDAEAPRRKFNSAITFREFALTSVFTFAVVFALAEAVGVVVVLCTAAGTLGLRLLSHRWLGGVSSRFLLASAQGIETLVVVLFAFV